MSRQEPSEEEIRAALDEQMRNITAEDVLLQSIVTFVNLAGRRLGLSGSPDELDLPQAALAIESTRALLPLVADDQAPSIRDALSQLQVAYAREARAGQPPPPPAPGAAAEAGAPGEPAPASTEADEAERAKARSRIWTPPGS